MPAPLPRTGRPKRQMSREQRRARAGELRGAGWSLRAIAAELGVSYETARSDLRETPGPVPVITGRVVARQPSSAPATRTSSPTRRTSSPAARIGRDHQDHAPDPRLPAVRVPGLLAQMFGGSRTRGRPPGTLPCADCADERIREPSGQFPAAVARDRASGRAVCDHHARERNGGRLRHRDLGMLPNLTPPPPGQWRVTLAYPAQPPPGWAELPGGQGNATVDISGWYG